MTKTMEYTITDHNNENINVKLKIEYPPENENGIAYFFDGKSTWKQECMCAWDDVTEESDDPRGYLNLIDHINFAIIGGNFWDTLRNMKNNETIELKEEEINLFAKQID